MRVEIEDGKYTYIFNNGKASMLRHGEPWGRDVVGDKMVYCAFAEIERLRTVVIELEKKLKYSGMAADAEAKLADELRAELVQLTQERDDARADRNHSEYNRSALNAEYCKLRAENSSLMENTIIDIQRIDMLVEEKHQLSAEVARLAESECVATQCAAELAETVHAVIAAVTGPEKVFKFCDASNVVSAVTAEIERLTSDVKIRDEYVEDLRHRVRDALADATALRKEADGWREEAGHRKNRIDALNNTVRYLRTLDCGDVWQWTGDGSDHLESMSNGMVVAIRADQLRAMLAAQATPKNDDRARNGEPK